MPKIDTVYLIHHSHTDIGFTHDQPILWELQARFIDEALDAVERDADKHADETRFRWTVEATAPLLYWLRHATSDDVDRLVRAERAGLIEVTAMFGNVTPLYDLVQFAESFQALRRLRQDYGLEIGSAMNCDVNGHNWPLVDLLLDAGVHGFTMAINHHFGGAPQPRPWVFHWQGPSGRLLPTYNGLHYGRGLDFGIGAGNTMKFRLAWPRIERHLEKINYPLPTLMIQGIHPFGDNAGPFERFASFAREWNEAGRTPRIVLATPRMWWQAVAPYLEQLQTWRGDWTDYWNFGAISTAREVAIDRANRTRLLDADAIYAALRSLPPTPPGGPRRGRDWSERSFRLYRDDAWYAVNMWGEHTWGSDSAISAPEIDDSLAQLSHKRSFAYTARSLSLMLQRDALADFAHRVKRNAADDILLFNPLPWPRTLCGPLPDHTVKPRGRPEDSTTGRHFQGHYLWPTSIHHDGPAQTGVGGYLPPTEVPAFGYATVPKANILPKNRERSGNDDTIENSRYRITFDRRRGGITSLFDKEQGWELVDATAPYHLHNFVHEEVANLRHGWPRHLLAKMDWSPNMSDSIGWKPHWKANRTTPRRVKSHKVYRSPLGIAVEQRLDHPAVGRLAQRVFLPDHDSYVECESEWEMGLERHPEATYLLFPFNLPGATARFDVGGVSVRPGDDQLPGVCRDYFTVQNWVDFSNGERGVTVALPENPLIQLGDFHFAHYQQEFKLERAMLLGWVTNNYWETNFEPYQPGTVYARYRILPYAGPFDEARAHRCGAEAAHRQLIAQHMGEPTHTTDFPSSGALLHLPEAPILTLHIRPTTRGLLLRLFNATDQPNATRLASNLLKIRRSWRCDLFDQPQEEIAVAEGALSVELPARRMVVLQLETA